MSTISLPEFMDRTSLKKSHDRSATLAPRRSGSAGASAGSLRQPRYRTQYASTGGRSSQLVKGSRYSSRVCQADARLGAARTHDSAPSEAKNVALPLERKLKLQDHNEPQKTARSSRFRLTRRGRLVFRGIPVLTLVALVVLGALTFVFPAQAKSSSHQPSVPASQTVTVYHGDSLWTIAQQVAPEQDSRDVVNRMMRLNDLTSTQVQPGQVLEVPLYSE